MACNRQKDTNILRKTRMTTFIKTKFKISDDQTNIDKYRLSANIQSKKKEIFKSFLNTEIGLLWSSESFGEIML